MQFIIPEDHPSLPGHFPGRPIVPGVVLLDRVIDVIETSHGELSALRMPRVKFLKPLLPGELASVQLQGEAPRFACLLVTGPRPSRGSVVGGSTYPHLRRHHPGPDIPARRACR